MQTPDDIEADETAMIAAHKAGVAYARQPGSSRVIADARATTLYGHRHNDATGEHVAYIAGYLGERKRQG